jgi:MoaA/NifB/PqqE/SkfB family radical SAM enzyme
MRRKFKKIVFNKLKNGDFHFVLDTAASYFLIYLSILKLKAYRGPLLGIIIPTYRCNLRCEMCGFWKRKPKREFDTREIFKVIDNFAEIGTKAISFSGGEPLLRKDIFNMIKYSKERGMITHLATNGTLVNEEVAKKLFDLEIDAISISLDGATPEIHDDIRGVRGSFEKTVTGLKNLSDIFKYTETSIDVTVLFSEHNFPEIHKIVKLANGIGIKSVGLTPLHNLLNEAPGANRIKAEKIAKAVDDIISIKKENGIIDNSTEYLEQIKKYFEGADLTSPCSAGVTTCVFDCYGDIFPCYGHFEMGKKVANTKNVDLKELWFSKEYDELRKSLFKCKKCIWNCHSEFNLVFKRPLLLRKFLEG